MEQEIIAIAQKPNTRNINERIAITELLEMGASWMGMVACWWAAMLMQGGIFFTLETKDCLFAIVIFLFICFRHRLYFCPQATWSLTEANRSLWTYNIQQLALSIGCISRLFYWYKLFSAISCAVLSMMRLISQDFGQTEVANMATRNFSINVFYVLALIETLLLLLALILRMLFERAKKENKEHKVERAKEENKEHKEEEKDDENEAEHEIIEIPDQTNTCIQQQDSSNLMLDNNGEGTSHTMTGKGVPEFFFFEENIRERRKIFIGAVAMFLGSIVSSLAVKMLWGHYMFILETRFYMFANVMFLVVFHLFKRAKKENKEHQASSNPMLNNNGEGTSHTTTGKGAPEKFFCKENTRDVKSWKLRAQALKLLALAANILELMVSSLGAIMLWRGHMFTLETKDRMFTTVIILLACIRLFNSHLQVARYKLGNNIKQHIRGFFYWFQLVSASICVVLSMMGLVSQYYGQTEVIKMVSQHFDLGTFYCFTLAEALLSVAKIRYIRIMTIQQKFRDRMTGQQTAQSNNIRPKYRRMELTKASEHPAAFIPEREKCKIIEKKTK